MNAADTGAIQSRDELEASMALVTALTCQLDDEIVQQNAKLVLAHKHDGTILDLKRRIDEQQARIQFWAEQNRETFGEGKSLALRQGVIGFRLGNRAVHLLEGWTDALVLAKLRQLGRRFTERYIRNKPELNRQAILQDSKLEVGKLPEKTLARIGLSVGQSEKFFCEPKLEPLTAAA